MAFGNSKTRARMSNSVKFPEQEARFVLAAFFFDLPPGVP